MSGGTDALEPTEGHVDGVLDDSWSAALLAPGGSPARADAVAPAPRDAIRQAALACWLLLRAARDGSTWLPGTVLRSALESLGSDDGHAGLQGAVSLGVVAVLDEGVFALPGLALVEQEAAEQVERLTFTDGSVHLVAGPRGRTRADAVAAAGPTDAGVVEDIERLGLPELAQALEQVEDGGHVVLAGDPDLMPAGPGRVLRDLLAAQSVPRTVVQAQDEDPGPARALHLLRAAVRRGVLPPPESLASPERSVAIVPVATDQQAAARVRQLVEVSIPRAFELAPEQIAVVPLLSRGAAGARALAEALGPSGCRVEPVSPGLEPAGAVVLVLPPSAAGVLQRDLLLTALVAATRHVSIVSGVGYALPRAVSVPPRATRTRLTQLLDGY